jgi:hypothetical protein
VDQQSIIDQLKAELSLRNTEYIAHWIGDDAERFKQIVDIMFTAEPTLQMRASWVISILSDKKPELLTPYVNRIITDIDTFKHPGARRNLLRYLAQTEIPEVYYGELYDKCFTWLLSKDEPPAVKVHSMQILVNIAEILPDLKREIRLVMEELTDHESAAIRSRSRHLMGRL